MHNTGISARFRVSFPRLHVMGKPSPGPLLYLHWDRKYFVILVWLIVLGGVTGAVTVAVLYFVMSYSAQTSG